MSLKSIMIKLIYKVTKENILKDKIKNKDKSKYSDALAFALKNNLLPILDIDFLKFEDEDIYIIDKSTMLYIFVNLQNHYDNNKKIIFEDIKSQIKIGSIGKGKDILIDICRYFYLSNKFDQNFWNHFINNAEHNVSIEIYSINKKFKIDEIL